MKSWAVFRIWLLRKTIESDGRVLYRALIHPKVSWYVKGLILVVGAYIIFPIDIVPWWILGFGILDDIGIAVLGITQIKKLIPAPLLAELTKKIA